jgi:glycosyltransferase involved in cell wall biosynthesis
MNISKRSGTLSSPSCSETLRGRDIDPPLSGSDLDAVLVGHPFAPIGMGELLRTSFRAFQSMASGIRVHDLYRYDPVRDADLHQEFDPYLTEHLSPTLNVFHLNGNEIADAFRALRPSLPPTSYNIIWPMWELSRYPGEWASEIGRFHEVWVASRFTEESLRAAVSIPVSRMPLGVEPRISRFLSRRYFGIPEASFIFLFMFDFLSFVERKNPFAVLEAFRRLRRLRPVASVQLVIKLNNASRRPIDHRRFLNAVAEIDHDVIVIDRLMTGDETKNLIRCCDCFVSLHRTEGFGFPLAEAMYFRKPVIATGYSSNLEFMNKDTSCLIPYRLVPVPEGSYPHAEGQLWAEPDIDAAVETMVRLLDDPAYRRALGERASRHLRMHLSYRAAGLRCVDRVARILGMARSGPDPLDRSDAGGPTPASRLLAGNGWRRSMTDAPTRR